MKPVYEVVSGSILLSKREDFFRLHRDWLLPMMHKIGIRPVLLLMTEIGSYGKFLDIYRYDSLAQYEELTDRLLSHPELQSYYAEVGQCILGSISIEIMREMPYAASVIGDEELAEDRQHKRPPAAVAPAFAPRPRDIRCHTRMPATITHELQAQLKPSPRSGSRVTCLPASGCMPPQ